jgi:hypothetical protein
MQQAGRRPAPPRRGLGTERLRGCGGGEESGRATRKEGGARRAAGLPEKTLTPLRKHLDDLLVPFKQAEAIDAELRLVVPHAAVDFLVLAWHHEHLRDQAGSKKKGYHQRERDFWLACADGLLGDAFDTLKVL